MFDKSGNSVPESLADLGAPPEPVWQQILAARAGGTLNIPRPWHDVFAPLMTPALPFCIGQLGQSLDGRIATPSGHSHYINGPEALHHLHRLRALVDAVVVGIGTALADDPQLNVRHVAGHSPARVVIDPRNRLPVTARLLQADGSRRLVISGAMRPDLPPDVEQVVLSGGAGGQIAPAEILQILQARGLSRVLIEGGAHTLSNFLAAGCLHRLHVALAPLIIGAGPVGLNLPPVVTLDQALRPSLRSYRLGRDLLLDINF